MNRTGPEIIRIGVANAQIKFVTPQRVEYLDEAGQECFVDLAECARNWVQSLKEDEGDFVLMTPEEKAWDSRCVGRRALIFDPPWIEFTNNRRTRFVFESSNEALGLKLQLMRVRWLTFDVT